MRIPIVPSIMRSGAKQDAVELRSGQMYRATVVVKNENGVLLRLGGILIEAETEIPLQTGQSLLLKAEQSTGSAITLRIVVPEEAAQKTAGNTSPLENALTQLGLPTTSENVAAAKVLLDWFQPITADNVTELTRDAQAFAVNNKEAFLNVRGWTMAVNIPEDRATINVVTRFLMGVVEPEQIPLAIKHINQTEQTPPYPAVSVLWWHNEAQHGEIYLFKDEHKTGNQPERASTLAIRVQTQRLGEIWVRFAYAAPELELAFVSPFPETLNVMRERQTQLGIMAASLGMNLQKVHYRQGLPASFLDIVPPRQSKEYAGLNLLV